MINNTMRRALSAAPRPASKILSSTARPTILSPAHVVSPVANSSMRQYHQKDKHNPDDGMDAQLTCQVLLDHYSSPRNVGSMNKADGDVGTGLVGAPACGDVMKLQIKVDPKNNTISDVKFKTFGCGSAIAVRASETQGDKNQY